MNIHISQSIQTVAELRLIANAAKRFVKPSSSQVAINAKQDTLMGSYVQTHDLTRIDWKDCMNILMTTTIGINNNIPKHKNISGKYLFSEIIPKGMNIIRKKDNDEYQLRIHNGQLTDGVLGKSEIAPIIQKLWFQYGSKETLNFIDDMQRMILQFLMRQGYTVGIKDTVVPQKVHDNIYKIIETKRKEAVGAITEYENDPYIMTGEAFETYLQKSLSSVVSDIQKAVMNSFSTENGINICISSGSSGTDVNAAQIVGCIGQVIVEGKRIRKKFNNRTLPTFTQHDDSPFARGFCYNSFISGLNPMEFFFQVMAGREGIINTAITTADKPQNRWVILYVSATGSCFQGWEVKLERKTVEISSGNRI
jgi:DNA-directed RNA polymerase beta' subunit